MADTDCEIGIMFQKALEPSSWAVNQLVYGVGQDSEFTGEAVITTICS